VGAGKTWRRLFFKIILRLAGGEAKEACGINQLCAGLKAGIKVEYTQSINSGRRMKRKLVISSHSHHVECFQRDELSCNVVGDVA
jgi:hypothetical protein